MKNCVADMEVIAADNDKLDAADSVKSNYDSTILTPGNSQLYSSVA